ncbi:hypothetical protein E2C01_041665 [Portunus trituberculatus]|uniref:Uncharacterized protein n=1 Tax=Portunus trituberculatus TaxID=210409 RepID=A0A5B7FUB5_PORTR|nr:hypothetical protein [Portunus trituberculatus]
MLPEKRSRGDQPASIAPCQGPRGQAGGTRVKAPQLKRKVDFSSPSRPEPYFLELLIRSLVMSHRSPPLSPFPSAPSSSSFFFSSSSSLPSPPYQDATVSLISP